jgi:hypothetical protein
MHGQSILIDLAGFKLCGTAAYPASERGFIGYESHKKPRVALYLYLSPLTKQALAPKCAMESRSGKQWAVF